MIGRINTVIYSVPWPQTITVRDRVWVDDQVVICCLQCGTRCYDTKALRGDTKCEWQNLLLTWWWLWVRCLMQRYYLFCRTLQPECVFVWVWVCTNAHGYTAFKKYRHTSQENCKHVLSLFSRSLGSFCWYYPGGLFIFLREMEMQSSHSQWRHPKPLIFFN